MGNHDDLAVHSRQLPLAVARRGQHQLTSGFSCPKAWPLDSGSEKGVFVVLRVENGHSGLGCDLSHGGTRPPTVCK